MAVSVLNTHAYNCALIFALPLYISACCKVDVIPCDCHLACMLLKLFCMYMNDLVFLCCAAVAVHIYIYIYICVYVSDCIVPCLIIPPKLSWPCSSTAVMTQLYVFCYVIPYKVQIRKIQQYLICN